MKTRFPVLLLFLALLTGCSTVYYPVLESVTDDYYQTRDSLVAGGAYYGRSPVRYADMGLYPWWSMDYFYLGYHPYSYWRSAYYSPYFYTQYNPVFYPSRHWYFHYGYSGFYAWNDPYWHYRSRHHGPWYGGSYRTPRRQESSGSQRRVTVAPYSGSSRHGMVIMSPVSQKNQPIRVGPVRSSGLSATVTPSSAVSAPPPRVATSLPEPSRPTTSPVRVITPSRSGLSRSTAAPSRSLEHLRAADLSRDRSSPGRARLERKRN